MSTVLKALNRALHRAMEADPEVYFLGEDILDPYGGAFKVTVGLSTKYPKRVWTTPISEAAITGVATGMALRGLRPVVEIMFGDFLTLAYDQILNHATKFSAIYNGRVRVPLLIRTPMGGGRGYGPTHSQCTEKLFLGVPGLRVLACNAFYSPEDTLFAAILGGDSPTLFVEHKLLYGCHVHDSGSMPDVDVAQSGGPWPTQVLRLRGAPRPAVTFVTYGYTAELVHQAMLKLAYEYELFTEILVPVQIKPFDPEPVLRSVSQTRRLITVEEGGRTSGWGSEVIATVAERMPAGAALATRRVAAADTAIPSTRPLEELILPSVHSIVAAALKIAGPARG